MMDGGIRVSTPAWWRRTAVDGVADRGGWGGEQWRSQKLRIRGPITQTFDNRGQTILIHVFLSKLYTVHLLISSKSLILGGARAPTGPLSPPLCWGQFFITVSLILGVVCCRGRGHRHGRCPCAADHARASIAMCETCFASVCGAYGGRRANDLV